MNEIVTEYQNLASRTAFTTGVLDSEADPEYSTSKTRVITALAALIGLASIWFGVNFLLNPHSAAAGFGINPWPKGNAAGYFGVKATPDIAAGAVAERRSAGCC